LDVGIANEIMTPTKGGGMIRDHQFQASFLNLDFLISGGDY
jgi:hypothetical protein